MLDNHDLTNSYHVESLYRSVAMLPPGAKALNREETLLVFRELKAHLEARDRA